MTAASDRHQKIVELARRHGFVSIESLSQRFSVTTQTVRRDINQLCRQKLLQRYHGGAGLPSSVENLAYTTRQVMYQEEKRRIAHGSLVPRTVEIKLAESMPCAMRPLKGVWRAK